MPPRRDLEQSFLLPDIDRPFGETPRSDHRLKKKKRLPRSARTRRSFRRRRQRLSRAGVRGVQYGVDGNSHLVQCSVGSVKHTTLPLLTATARGEESCRCWFNFGPQLRTPGCSGRYALRTSVSSNQPACRPRVPRCCRWPVPVSLIRSARNIAR